MTDNPAATLLAASGLTDLPEDELVQLVHDYPPIRRSLDLLYAPEFADADPYLVPTIKED